MTGTIKLNQQEVGEAVQAYLLDKGHTTQKVVLRVDPQYHDRYDSITGYVVTAEAEVSL